MVAPISALRVMDRYLLRRFFVPLGYCMAAFLLVMLLYDFSINLEDFIDGKVRFDIVLEYFAYSIPVKIADVVPMATLLSILYCIGQLKRHNETLAFQASGVSLTRLILPFLYFGLFASVVMLFVNETVIPPCQQRIAKIEAVYMKKGDTKKAGAQPSVFAYYNLRQQRSWVGMIDPSRKKLQRIEIRTFDASEKLKEKIVAAQAAFDGNRWNLSDGKVVLYDETGAGTEGTRTFASETFTFPETLKDLLDSLRDIQYMSLGELRKHIVIHPKDSRAYQEEMVTYHSKWACPLIQLIVMLIGVPLGLRGAKSSVFVAVGTSLTLFVAYYGVNLISLAMGKNEMMAAWLAAWLPNILFGLLGLTLVAKTK